MVTRLNLGICNDHRVLYFANMLKTNKIQAEEYIKVKTKNYFGMPQPLIHNLAKKYVSQSDIYKNYMIQHPQAKDAQGYVIWKFIEPSKQSKKIIWHFVNDENDYYELSKQMGLSYTFDDYKIIDSHQQRHHKKRPHL